MPEVLVAVRGGGDLGSGVALRLWRCGFAVVVLESLHPVAVRRTVAFAEAVYDGASSVEEAQGALASSPHQALDLAAQRFVPVLRDPAASSLPLLRPSAVIDAIMAKANRGTTRAMARVVVALGPGFEAGHDVTAVVETNRGPDLGRVIWLGQAEPNTGQPGAIGGKTGSRVLRAPATGLLRDKISIGDIVEEGEPVAEVDGRTVCAHFKGLVRGLARSGLTVEQGMKIGDIDPRLDPSLCTRVSDKSLSVAGGVLEALMMGLKEQKP